MTNILENNKCIAEFMGATESAGRFYRLDGEVLAHEVDLKYHTSYDRLIPVIKKLQTVLTKPTELDTLKDLLWYEDIKLTWQEVGECIKYYNENNNGK